MTILDAYNAFMNDRAVYCSPETLRSYEGHLKIFFGYLEASGGGSAGVLSFDDFKEASIFGGFILHLRGKNVRNVTIRSYCRAVKAFLKFCYNNDICRDYLKGVKLPPDDSRPKQVLYADEAGKIDACFSMASEKGRRSYCIFHLMLDCGLRPQEVRRLRSGDIDRERNILRIPVSKGCKSRIVLIPDFLIRETGRCLFLRTRISDFVFLQLSSCEPLTSNSIKQLFSRLKKESGIERLHAHLLRHTFATSFLTGGGSLEFLRVFMGHGGYNVTRIYSSLAAECMMPGADVYRLDPVFFKNGY